METPYQTLPELPEAVSSTNVMARLVDGLGFRYRWATEGLTENEHAFRPCETSMNMTELMQHLYNLAYTANTVLGGSEEKRDLTDFDELRSETLRLYKDLGERLLLMPDSQLAECTYSGRREGFPFWYLLNGQIADALTHVGQIVSWRRIAGNPQPQGVNVFLGTKI